MLDNMRLRKILVALATLILINTYGAPMGAQTAPSASPLLSPVAYLPLVRRAGPSLLYLPLVLKR